MKVRMLRNIEVNGEHVAAGECRDMKKSVATSWVAYGICTPCEGQCASCRAVKPEPAAEQREKAVQPGAPEVK